MCASNVVDINLTIMSQPTIQIVLILGLAKAPLFLLSIEYIAIFTNKLSQC